MYPTLAQTDQVYVFWHLPNVKCMYKKERDVLKEEMRNIDKCDIPVEEFGTLDSSDTMISILGDRWWPQAARKKGG